MYQHTQRSPLHLLLYVPAIFMFILAWQIQDDAPPSIAVALAGLVVLIIGMGFQTLTVAGKEDHLQVRYGPLNLFGTRIAYHDITAVELDQTSLIDGWGIHFIPFRGWTLNLWGFECVKISRGDKVIRIGTDDSEQLARFLIQRIGSA